jgi:hypothetical protein
MKLAALVMTVCVTACGTSATGYTRTELVGTWTATSPNGNAQFTKTFSADGTFQETAIIGAGDPVTDSGTFTVSGHTLTTTDSGQVFAGPLYLTADTMCDEVFLQADGPSGAGTWTATTSSQSIAGSTKETDVEMLVLDAAGSATYTLNGTSETGTYTRTADQIVITLPDGGMTVVEVDASALCYNVFARS